MVKRFIEWNMPINYISENATREPKKGHISSVATWWARRPLAISRTTIFASLMDLPDNSDETDELMSLLKNLSTPNKSFLKEGIKSLKKTWNKDKPKVLDPFAGGGSIPFEAMRLGCETYANDLNPVASIILNGILVWPKQWISLVSNSTPNIQNEEKKAKKLLFDLVQKYANLIEERTKERIGKFFNYIKYDEEYPLAFYWIKVFTCPNKLCRYEIPLMRNFHIANKAKKKVALKPYFTDKKVFFNLVFDQDIDFNASKGNIVRGKFQCLQCKQVFSSNLLRQASFRNGLSEKLVAIMTLTKTGKKYFLATDTDSKIYHEAKKSLSQLLEEWPYEFSAIPNEKIRTPTGSILEEISDPFYVHLQIVNYGFGTWGHLFNDRQKISLASFLLTLKEIEPELYEDCKTISMPNSKILTNIVYGYLSFIFNRFISYNTNLNRWVIGGESIANCFSRTGLQMVYDYPEVNPFANSFGWKTQVNWILEFIHRNSWMDLPDAVVTNTTASNLPYEDNFFDAIITDPPYYNNVPYADLSDFFYVLFKRILSDFYPEFFHTPLTPKLEECIANENLLRRKSTIKLEDFPLLGIKDKKGFNLALTSTFKELSRILKPDGIVIVVYAHKTNEGWETLIESLHKSNFVVTGSWPFHTELKNRLQARSTAALASSVYMVCRKRKTNEIGFFSELTELAKIKIFEKLDFFWQEGILGGDFFISSIGPALEIFLQYKKILSFNGEEISSTKIIDFIRQTCSRYILYRLLKSSSIETIDKPSLFYLLYRWMFLNQDVEYEDARKLAFSTGFNIEQSWNRKNSFIMKKGQKIKVLNPEEREEINETRTLIDGLHKAILLWKNQEYNEIYTILKNFNTLQEEFWLLCQAISESLEPGMHEKKLLESFLHTKRKILALST